MGMKAVKGIKRAQVRKYQAYAAGRRGRKPIGYNIYKNKNADPGFTTEVSAVPVAVSAQASNANMRVATSIRTEQSMNVTNATNGYQPVSLPLHPMNTGLFTSLPKIASQYQYFKIVRMSFTYTPQVGTGTAGMLAMGVAASDKAAENIKLFDNISGLTNWKRDNIFKPITLQITPDMLNKQYAAQGCVIADWSSVDTSDPQFIPGYLCLGVNGTADASDATVNGSITVSYRIQLLKPQVDGDTDDSQLTLGTAGFAGTANWFAALKAKWDAYDDVLKTNHPYTLTFTNTTLVVKALTLRPLIIEAFFAAAADTNPVLPVPVAVNATNTVFSSMAGTRYCRYLSVLRPTRLGATITYTAGAQNVTDAHLHISQMNRSHFDRLEDLSTA